MADVFFHRPSVRGHLLLPVATEFYRMDSGNHLGCLCTQPVQNRSKNQGRSLKVRQEIGHATHHTHRPRWRPDQAGRANPKKCLRRKAQAGCFAVFAHDKAHRLSGGEGSSGIARQSLVKLMQLVQPLAATADTTKNFSAQLRSELGKMIVQATADQ